jgi:hypothetical protein
MPGHERPEDGKHRRTPFATRGSAVSRAAARCREELDAIGALIGRMGSVDSEGAQALDEALMVIATQASSLRNRVAKLCIAPDPPRESGEYSIVRLPHPPSDRWDGG